MKRLVFIVEGDTEIILIEKLVVPYLISLGFNIPIHAQTIITNRKQHKKGGIGSYGKFKNEVVRTLSQGNVIITTLIDFYGLPHDFPEYSSDSSKIENMEIAIKEDIGSENFIPYIQKYELEGLMFSDRSGFELVIDDIRKMNEIDIIIQDFPNPEDINNSSHTAPSKRLERIFNYDKTGDGELIFEMIGIQNILNKCPRFSRWIQQIILSLS